MLKRKKRFILLTMLVCIALAAAFMTWNFGWLDSNTNKIKHALETTVITSPLRQDGSVDYPAALNQKNSVGVTFDNNMVVELYRLAPPTGRDDQGAPSPRERAFAKALGFEEIPIHSLFLCAENKAHLRVHSIKGNSERDLEMAKLKSVCELVRRPWKSEEVPEFAEYLNENKTILDEVVTATNREHFYFPIISDEDFGYWEFDPVGTISFCRTICHELNLRAMNSIGESKIGEAIEDVKAIRRIAFHLFQSDSVNTRFSARNVVRTAVDVEQTLLTHPSTTSQQLTDYKRFLMKCSLPFRPEEQIGIAVRFHGLDMIIRVHQSGADSNKGSRSNFWQGLLDGTVDFLVSRFNINSALKRYNELVDQHFEALGQGSIEIRNVQLIKFDEEICRQHVDRRRIIWWLTHGSKAKGRIFAELNFVSQYNSFVFDIEVARLAQHRSMLAALAVARFKKDRGILPESLNDLVPEYLESIPLDPCTDEPLHYRTIEEGFAVFSRGLGIKEELNSVRQPLSSLQYLESRPTRMVSRFRDLGVVVGIDNPDKISFEDLK